MATLYVSKEQSLSVLYCSLIIIDDIVLIDMEAAMIDDRPMKSNSRSIFDFIRIIIIIMHSEQREKYLGILTDNVSILL